MLLMGVFYTMADPVTPQTAATVAGNYWRGLTSKTAELAQVENSGFEYLYLFRVNNGEGFVIVAADDAAYPILGYGIDEPAGELGPETRFWLEQYEHEIAALASGDVSNDDPVLAAYISRQWDNLRSGNWSEPKSGNMVPAMLTTRWNQSPYYNYYAPQNCPIGCVATAVAQVMKFWNHPVKGTGNNSYNTPYGVLSANFDTTYYDWAHMPNSISSSSSMQEIEAVALLSYHVAVAVNMNFSTDGSGANLVGGSGTTTSAQSALRRYFGYSNSLHGEYKSYYSDAEWIRLLKDELDAGRPVLYAGYDSYAGHAFVFDGYNSSSQFHVNWGWGGSYNGFFAMGALNPGGGGVGTNTSNTFNSSNQIIVGVEPLPRLNISPSSISFGAEGGSQSVAVTGTYSVPSGWTASIDGSWLSSNPSTLSGSGNGVQTNVTLIAAANTTGQPRTATITLVQDGDTVQIPVVQFSCASSAMCTLTVGAYDSRSNGWGSNKLQLSSTSGILYGEMTLADGSYGIREFSVCPDTVVVTWLGNSSIGECGFFVENSEGVVWLNHAAGSELSNGDTFLIVAPCLSEGGVGPVRFAVNVTVNDTTRGYIEGGSDDVAFGESITLTARAREGYRFTKWNDGSVDNPRSLTILTNSNMTARFDNLGNDTLHYDNGSYNLAYGGDNGTYWGIRFPTSSLVGHTTLESVKFYNVRAENYTLNIYQGDSPRQMNLVATMSFYQSRQTRYRWVEKVLDTPITLNHSKPLWITMSCESGDATAVASEWCGNSDGSWYSASGNEWQDINGDDLHLTWMLRAHMPVDPNEYGLSVLPNNRQWGSVSGGGLFRYGQPATLVATPVEGYHFDHWSDGSTENPHVYYVRGESVIRGYFAEGVVGINSTTADGITLTLQGLRLTALGADNLPLCVYDALGRVVFRTDNYQGVSIPLPAAGIYVVRIEGKAMRKVVALGN